MPENKLTGTQVVSVIPGGTSILQFSQDDNKIICRICLVPFDYEQGNIKLRTNKQINSTEHQKQAPLDSKKQQQFSVSVGPSSQCIFCFPYRSFSLSEYSFEKLENNKLRVFIQTNSDVSTLRKGYISHLSNEGMENTKKFIGKSNYYIMSDEATNPSGRFMVGNIGKLDTLEKPHLIQLSEVIKTDSVANFQQIKSTLNSFFAGQIDYTSFRLFVTNGSAFLS